MVSWAMGTFCDMKVESLKHACCTRFAPLKPKFDTQRAHHEIRKQAFWSTLNLQPHTNPQTWSVLNLKCQMQARGGSASIEFGKLWGRKSPSSLSQKLQKFTSFQSQNLYPTVVIPGKHLLAFGPTFDINFCLTTQTITRNYSVSPDVVFLYEPFRGSTTPAVSLGFRTKACDSNLRLEPWGGLRLSVGKHVDRCKQQKSRPYMKNQ